MRLCNADVDEAERNPAEFEDFDEPEDEDGGDGGGSSKSFFDLRQRTLSGMDLMPAFRVVVLGLARKLKNNTKDSILYSEVEDALGRYFRVLDADMQRFANLHEILRDAADKGGAAAAGYAASSAVLGTHNAGVGLLHEGMREIAVVLLACGEMQRQCLDLKLDAQRSIATSAKTPHISYSKYADFLDEALALCDQLRRKHEELQQQRIRAMAKLTEAKLAAGTGTEAECGLCADALPRSICKFAVIDSPFVRGILGDLFPEEGLIKKCIQLCETIMGRHGLMLVDQAFSGKTEVGNVCAMEAAALAVQTHKINPKSIKLYGENDEGTQDETLALTVPASSAEQNKARQILLNEPVDAVWMENLNTALDDSKKLCLNTGEIIKLPPVTTMMFEVEDFAAASPTTVSDGTNEEDQQSVEDEDFEEDETEEETEEEETDDEVMRLLPPGPPDVAIIHNPVDERAQFVCLSIVMDRIAGGDGRGPPSDPAACKAF
eukprot:symbB.v1.2.012430.t1/scaffold849.1/size158081/13